MLFSNNPLPGYDQTLGSVRGGNINRQRLRQVLQFDLVAVQLRLFYRKIQFLRGAQVQLKQRLQVHPRFAAEQFFHIFCDNQIVICPMKIKGPRAICIS